MPHTALFTDYIKSVVIGPKGGKKRITSPVQVEDTLHPVSVTYMGKTFNLYVRGKDLGRDRKALYYADGTPAKGTWQHGPHGNKTHIENIEICDGEIVTRTSYSLGPVKGQHKYLTSII